MDNRVIHGIAVIIATLSLSSSWRGCNWNNHQRRQFILPDSTRSGWNHLCFPQQPIVLGCTTVLHTLHQVEFTMRFSEGSLCHKLRRRRRLGGKTGGGEEAGCGGGGVQHYGRFLLCFPSITDLSYRQEEWDRTREIISSSHRWGMAKEKV